ncbi:biogenesis of lysosome-related organelles complex 1 subunit 4 [Chironomus tepperi]|uniref:biogenesis of lysosome-related organelles complex 1 subunit 4 n=1 Tax=Chironomus tepperi TaxID=113505 RepID=UPI00391EED39
MAKELSKDYASYFINSDISNEITPILSTTDNIQTRIHEIENVFLPTIRHDSEITQQNITQLLEFKPKFENICEQIDNLENMVDRIKSDLCMIQKQVDVADEELDIPEKKIDIILKSLNIFAKSRDLNETNWNSDGIYEAPKIFKANDFFKKQD